MTSSLFTGRPIFIYLLRISALFLIGMDVVLKDLNTTETFFLIIGAILLFALSGTWTYVRVVESRLVWGRKLWWGLKQKTHNYPVRVVKDIEFEPIKIFPLIDLTIADIYLTLESHKGRIHHRYLGNINRLKGIIKYISEINSGN